MQALKPCSVPSLFTPQTHLKTYLHFTSLPTSCLHSNIQRNALPRPKLYTTQASSLSSVVSTEAEVGSDQKKEKFIDWYSQWYPVMAVCELDKRVPHAIKIVGVDVVVWWDRNEECWRVFDDACPHRLAPLSEGRIDQRGRLQCAYHGWCFNGSSECKFIPQASPDGPPVHTFKKACVGAYPSTVQREVLWFWPNTSPEYKDILSVKKPPYIPELDDPSFTILKYTREIPCGYEILLENLMDPAHVPYAHYKIIPNELASRDNKKDREGGVPMDDINIHTLCMEGFQGTRNGGNSNSKFIAPCVYCESSIMPNQQVKQTDKGNGAASSTEIDKVPMQETVFLCLVVPVSPGRSRLIYSFSSNFKTWTDRVIPRWITHLGQNLVLDSDMCLLHVGERKILEVGPENWQKACFIPTKSDAPVVAFRKWLRKYSSGAQFDWRGKFNGELPPTPPKEQLLERYESHVVNCSSCRVAHKGLKALELALQIVSFVSIATVAATKQAIKSSAIRTSLVLFAILCFGASKWLAHFIYKNFHYHGYNHALV